MHNLFKPTNSDHGINNEVNISFVSNNMYRQMTHGVHFVFRCLSTSITSPSSTSACLWSLSSMPLSQATVTSVS